MDDNAYNGIQQLALLQYEGASTTPKTKEPTFDNPIPHDLVSSLLVFYMELLINRIVKMFNYLIGKDIFILIVALVVVRYSNNLVSEIYNFSYYNHRYWISQIPFAILRSIIFVAMD